MKVIALLVFLVACASPEAVSGRKHRAPRKPPTSSKPVPKAVPEPKLVPKTEPPAAEGEPVEGRRAECVQAPSKLGEIPRGKCYYMKETDKACCMYQGGIEGFGFEWACVLALCQNSCGEEFGPIDFQCMPVKSLLTEEEIKWKKRNEAMKTL
jgi:hypothetical protein